MFNILKVTTKGFFQKLVREGYKFRKTSFLLNKLDSTSESFRKDYQLAALREVMSYAHANIPIWRRKFKESGFDPKNISNVEDLKNLPLLTKKEVQKNIKGFLAPKIIKAFLSKGLTSGTTGSPGIFYRDFRSVNFENAILWLIRSKVGMNYGNKIVSLRGDIVVPSTQSTPPFWIVNLAEKKLMVSTYHLIPKYREQIIQKIKSFQAKGAFAYPSAAYILACWCKDIGIEMPFKNLQTSSEMILHAQRETIRSVLKGPWVDLYGQAERVSILVSLNLEDYFLFSEYAVTELIPTENGQFEIIGSTLHNYAMPLFRYKTGDLVTSIIENGEGRPIVKDLSGRREDFVRLPDGRLIGRLDLVFKGLKNIIEGQIYQVSLKNIIIRVVRDTGYSQNDNVKLLENARMRLGHEIKISIEYVDKIPRMNQNKFKFVVSDLDFSSYPQS